MDTIVLVRHHDRSASPMWEHRARRFNFYLRDSNSSFFCGSQLLNEGDHQMEAVSEWNGRTSREIVGALRERVRTAAHRRHDRVLEHAGRHWISWRSRRADRVFAEIRPLRGRVQVFILPG